MYMKVTSKSRNTKQNKSTIGTLKNNYNINNSLNMVFFHFLNNTFIN